MQSRLKDPNLFQTTKHDKNCASLRCLKATSGYCFARVCLAGLNLLHGRRLNYRYNLFREIRDCDKDGHGHPARWAPGSDSSGTRTWIVVPPIGLESMAIVPFTSRTRSRMLVRPRPFPCNAASVSNPLP